MKSKCQDDSKTIYSIASELLRFDLLKIAQDSMRPRVYSMPEWAIRDHSGR